MEKNENMFAGLGVGVFLWVFRIPIPSILCEIVGRCKHFLTEPTNQPLKYGSLKAVHNWYTASRRTLFSLYSSPFVQWDCTIDTFVYYRYLKEALN